MRISCSAFALLLLAVAPGTAQETRPAGAPWGGGPLPVRDLFLLEIPFLGFVPEGPAVLPRAGTTVEVHLTEANTFTKGGDIEQRMADRDAGLPQADGYGIFADGEATVVRTTISFGVGKGTELRATIPLVYLWGGFLDRIIEATHDITGLPDDDRPDYGRNDLYATVLGDGVSWELQDGSAGIGDVVLEGRCALREKPGKAAFTLSALLKAPTGDEDAGRGSGEWDGGLLLASTWPAGAKGLVHANLAYFHLGEPDLPGLDVRDPVHAMAGYEYVWNPRWSVVGQAMLSSGIWPSASDLEADGFRADLAAGFRYGLPGRRAVIQAGFLQNVTLHDNEADFTLFFGTLFRL